MSLKSFFVKGFVSSLVLALICTYSFTDYASAQHQESVEESTFTMNDPELYQEAKELGLTDEEIIKMDKLLDEPKVVPYNQVAVVIGIAVGISTLVGTGYKAGRYIAKQVEKRGALSKSQYKKLRWQFRAALPPVLGIPATLGFDDYFMGY